MSKQVKKWLKIIVVCVMAFMLVASYSFFLIPGLGQSSPPDSPPTDSSPSLVADFEEPTGPPPSLEDSAGFRGPTSPPSATVPAQGPIR